MKYLKIGIDELYAFAIIAFATLLRIILASQGWPPINSDEGTMGLMALHIAYRGEHPIVFYGQNYMGALEAYLAAAMFHLFGPSLFTLRLGVILLTALFFVTMYLLTSLLYTKKLALITLVLLSLGSSYIFTRQLITTGGSAETLLFGSLAFLLASWLALSCGQYPSPRRQWRRFVGYGCWGIVVGLGLWSDLVVLPFFAMASLLLVLFCWRDLKTWAPLCLILGFIIGAFPLIAYNYKALLHGQDSLTILLGLVHGRGTQAHHILHGVKETVLVSIPIATGNPFCPISELPWIGESSPHSLQCTIVHASWGLSYIVLLTLAVMLSAITLWKLRSQFRTYMSSLEERHTIVRHVAQFILLSSGILAIAAYALSLGPLIWPGIHARYLIGLLIVIPAVIAPLWGSASTIKLPLGRLAKVKVAVSRGMLLLIGILLLIGAINTFREIPSTQISNQQQDALIHDLVRIRATHIYTDYWTCDRIAFLSKEQIICAVADPDLQGRHNNRYKPYLSIVSADPRSAYVFLIDSPQAATMKTLLSGGQYQHFVFDGYIIYQPA